jgi:hypothetical protein
VSLEAQCLGSKPTLSLWVEPLPSRLTPREAKGGRPYLIDMIKLESLGVGFNLLEVWGETKL